MIEQINYSWKFISGFDKNFLFAMSKDAKEIDIPHCVKETNFNYFSEKDYQGIFTYQKAFKYRKNDNSVTFINFEGVMLQFHLFLNGIDLGNHISGFLPIRIEVTNYLKNGNNLLTVVVDTKEDKNIPPFGKACDYLTFGGIYRPVYLETLDKIHFEYVHIIKSTYRGYLEVETKLSSKVSGKINYFLYDGKTLISQFQESQFKLNDVHPWSLDDPHLYTLKAVFDNGIYHDEKTISVGFRDFLFTDKGFFLNGIKTTLIGVNRHQTYPYIGPSLPESAQKDDAQIIKYELGCNIVRTSHYPQSEAFLSECDRIGLLVQTEVPGWQYISTEEKWRNNFLAFIKGMVNKEINHPSLISYGIRVDESPDDDSLYSQAQKVVKSLDPNRATTGVRNFKTSHLLEDYYSYNDFSCNGLKHGLDDPRSIKAAKGKGILISENNGHMYPTKMYDPADRRVEQALRHLKVINDAYKYSSYLGEITWCAFDYNTHCDFGSTDHICYHGVYDIFRNPKPAGQAIASQFRKEPMLFVANSNISGDNDEAKVLPLCVFTNCDYLKLFKNGEYVSSFYPDKKNYPNLKHPPIMIDDFVGETFHEGFNKKDSKNIVKALNYIAQVGYSHIDYLKMLPFLTFALFKKIGFSKLNKWYYKYESTWGEKINLFTISAFKNNKEVLTKTVGPSMKFHLKVTQSKKELINDSTYDVSRISIIHMDQNDNQLYYSFENLTLKAEGPIEIIGKTEVSLIGGSLSVYVRSRKPLLKSKAYLIIHSSMGDERIEFLVR
ncbi:MAG: glycoside hydrolase family 2 TIM barrel-domain containing protein [Bacilli bacterium]